MQFPAQQGNTGWWWEPNLLACGIGGAANLHRAARDLIVGGSGLAILGATAPHP